MCLGTEQEKLGKSEATKTGPKGLGVFVPISLLYRVVLTTEVHPTMRGSTDVCRLYSHIRPAAGAW